MKSLLIFKKVKRLEIVILTILSNTYTHLLILKILKKPLIIQKNWKEKNLIVLKVI